MGFDSVRARGLDLSVKRFCVERGETTTTKVEEEEEEEKKIKKMQRTKEKKKKSKECRALRCGDG